MSLDIAFQLAVVFLAACRTGCLLTLGRFPLDKQEWAELQRFQTATFDSQGISYKIEAFLILPFVGISTLS